jgi:hypothetical protein
MPAEEIEEGDGNDSLAERHPHLYHYTDGAGLRGIVESNSLRATYFGNLNDANEILELRVPLVRELSRRLEPFVKEIRAKGSRRSRVISRLGGNAVVAQRLARTWANALYSTTFETKDKLGLCCITSFCSHANDQAYERENGLLSQWRGYGGDGGFCLVFDTAALSRQLEAERKTYFFLHAELQAAHYPIEGASPIDVFESLLTLSEGVIKKAVEGDRDFSSAELFVPFVGSATAFKHRGFFEEREVRLVAMAGTKFADDNIKDLEGYTPMPLREPTTILRDGVPRQYISLFGKDCDRLPIERVIVGPSRTQSDNVAIARKIVGNSIPVSKSATPFVGR